MKRPRDPDDRRNAEAHAGPCASTAVPSSSILPVAAPLPAPGAPKSKPPLPSSGLALPACPQGRQAEPVPAVPLSDSDAAMVFGATSERAAADTSRPKGSKVGPPPFEKPKQSCVSENASRSPIAREAFSALLLLLGDLSALGASLQRSSQDHVGRILQMFVAATVIRYCSAFRALAATILDLGFSLA